MDRRPTKVAAVALANKIARMAWAIMVHGERYREPKLNAGYAMPVLEAQEAKAAAQALGLEAARLQIWQSEDIAPAFEAIRGQGGRALRCFRCSHSCQPHAD